MTEEQKTTADSDTGNEQIPRGQGLLDNVYLLLALGVGVPLILYTLWGIIDLIRVPHLVP